MQGMKDMVRQVHQAPGVKEGFYDLLGPDGEIIPPEAWDEYIQPNMAITMRMWDVDKMLPSHEEPLESLGGKLLDVNAPGPPSPLHVGEEEFRTLGRGNKLSRFLLEARKNWKARPRDGEQGGGGSTEDLG